MALNSALKDKARTVGRTPAGRVVEGTRLYAEEKGPWFRCRLTVEMASEERQPGSRRQYPSGPTLLVGLKDVNGDPVPRFTGEVRLEVVSAELGTALWDLVVEAQPLRKKRRLVGYYMRLRRLETREAAA